MCFCNCSWVYKKLAYLHALTGFFDMICGIVRLAVFFTPGSSTNGTRKQYSSKYVAAFIIDWISSIIPTLVGLFVVVLILIFLFKLCACCYNTYKHQKGKSSDSINTSGVLRKLIRHKAIRRFLIIDCNCPCYKARPKLRFQIRFGLMVLFFILRITAIGLYASSQQTDSDGGTLAIVCAVSLIFLFNTLLLDLYRYCVWWHYAPANDTECAFHSKQHERFIPYHMIGQNRDPRTLGDRPCTDKPCTKRTLDHIAVFHSIDFEPQERWQLVPKPPYETISYEGKWRCQKSDEFDNQPHYIGFHTTDPKAAISISHGQFRPGSNGWLGPGVYFARSIYGTYGKAKSEGGATIIAEIRMGKVYFVYREAIDRNNTKFDKKIFDYVHHGAWQKEWDTCYMIHPDPSKDEFAIANADKQIVKWVMMIDQKFDSKVEDYGLATEFDTTKCFCI